MLDLRFSQIELEHRWINSILGMKDALPSTVQTFITVDFFDHDTKHTELTTGYKQELNTIFSFKNKVDDFYLNYISRETVLVEVFIISNKTGRHSEKIGEAKLPLGHLLKGDNSFQG